MTFSYDIATGGARDLVRLFISDTNTGEYIFEDAELDALLSLQAGNVRYAAADALEIMARSEAMISKRIKILDLQTDGPAVAKELRESAATLRAQGAIGADEPAIAIAEQVFDDFGAREAFRHRLFR